MPTFTGPPAQRAPDVVTIPRIAAKPTDTTPAGPAGPFTATLVFAP
jgi:hypothetical protein